MQQTERIRNIEQAIARRQALQEDRKLRVLDLKTEIEHLEREGLLLEKVEETLIQINRKTVGESAETLNKLVTLGLKFVFPDQDLEMKTVTEKSRGKTAVKFELYDRGRTFPIDDAFGGGVIAIAGILLRVSVISTLKLRRVLILDETLAHLATQYVPNASRLLRKLSEDLAFTIILVTHEPDYATHAHTHVKAQRRAGATVMTTQTDSSKG